jgi:regulator of replication initiation timing
MSKASNTDLHDRPEHLDQIRDIIFGPQRREFETRLRQLEEKLEDMKSSLGYAIEELSRTLTLELRSSVQSLEGRIKALDDQAATERSATHRTIEQLESRFDKSLQHTIQTAADKLSALDTLMKTEDAKLRQELSRLKDQLAHDLDERVTELAQASTSREMMAEALIELGMKVRAGERLSELKLISQKKPG